MSPFDTLGLVSFLITGLIITRLVTSVRARTVSSRLQQEMLQQLYDLAQQLLAIEPDAKAGVNFWSHFAEWLASKRHLCSMPPTRRFISPEMPAITSKRKPAKPSFRGKDYESCNTWFRY